MILENETMYVLVAYKVPVPTEKITAFQKLRENKDNSERLLVEILHLVENCSTQTAIQPKQQEYHLSTECLLSEPIPEILQPDIEEDISHKSRLLLCSRTVTLMKHYFNYYDKQLNRILNRSLKYYTYDWKHFSPKLFEFYLSDNKRSQKEKELVVQCLKVAIEKRESWERFSIKYGIDRRQTQKYLRRLSDFVKF